jgi:hypothetical protein
MLQLRQDGRAYAVDRDLVNLFITLARRASMRMAEENWSPALAAFARANNIAEADFIPAARALCRFAAEVNHGNNADFGGAWTNSGMGKLSAPVVMATMFLLGAETAAAYFDLNRTANKLGYRDRDADAVVVQADRAAHAMAAELPSAKARRARENLQAAGGADGQG